MASEYTSVPRLSGDVPPPLRAREIIAVSFTTAGAKAARSWLQLSEPGIPHRHIRIFSPDSSALSGIGAVVRRSKVGVHLAFFGPQTEIYAARAQAISSGALDAEITLMATEVTDARVYCAHCRVTTNTQNAVGNTVVCSGCGRELVIYHHFSRRMASYLGYMFNAEELP